MKKELFGVFQKKNTIVCKGEDLWSLVDIKFSTTHFNHFLLYSWLYGTKKHTTFEPIAPPRGLPYDFTYFGVVSESYDYFTLVDEWRFNDPNADYSYLTTTEILAAYSNLPYIKHYQTVLKSDLVKKGEDFTPEDSVVNENPNCVQGFYFMDVFEEVSSFIRLVEYVQQNFGECRFVFGFFDVKN